MRGCSRRSTSCFQRIRDRTTEVRHSSQTRNSRSALESRGRATSSRGTANRRLDALDLRILAILAENGRINLRELAERIGRAPTPTIRRVRALETDGYILGYHARINEDKLGKSFSVFVMVTLETQKEGALGEFEEQIRKSAEVMSCFMMT